MWKGRDTKPDSDQDSSNGVQSCILTNGFACDSMLKGLARWLRAGGYDAGWTYNISDDALMHNTRLQNRVLLTSDSGIMKRGSILAGEIHALFVPREMSVPRQVAHVFQYYGLRRLQPRCMKCGGALTWIPKASVRKEAPPRTYCWLNDFYRCLRCGQLFWKGTHWNKISEHLNTLIPEYTPSNGSPF